MEYRVKKEKSDKILRYREIFLRPLRERWEIEPGVFIERLETKKNALFLRLEVEKNKIITLGPKSFCKDLAIYSGEVIETRTKRNLKALNSTVINPQNENTFQAIEDSVLYAYLYCKE